MRVSITSTVPLYSPYQTAPSSNVTVAEKWATLILRENLPASNNMNVLSGHDSDSVLGAFGESQPVENEAVFEFDLSIDGMHVQSFNPTNRADQRSCEGYERPSILPVAVSVCRDRLSETDAPSWSPLSLVALETGCISSRSFRPPSIQVAAHVWLVVSLASQSGNRSSPPPVLPPNRGRPSSRTFAPETTLEAS